MAVAEPRHQEGVAFPLLALGYFGGALAWTLHLLISMAIVPIACDGRPGDIALYMTSGGALLLAVVSVIVSFRNWRTTDGSTRLSSASPRGYSHFLGLSGLAASVVFTIGIVFASIPVMVLGPCETSI